MTAMSGPVPGHGHVVVDTDHGFEWLGSWAACHRCGQPWHEHPGVDRPAPGAGPFSEASIVVPWDVFWRGA